MAARRKSKRCTCCLLELVGKLCGREEDGEGERVSVCTSEITMKRVELEKADLFSYLQKAQEEARRADERLVTSDDERLVTSDDERMLPPLVAMSQKSTGLQFFVLLPDVSSSQMSS